jgi:PelA/Pel-15E family pectate lyase
MSIEQPSDEVKASIQAAIRWFHEHRMEGVRIATIRAERVAYRWHVSDTDRIVVADAKAPPIWTRFYDLKTGRPVFFTRKSETVTDFREVPRERRTGYGWWVSGPRQLIDREYPAWQSRHAPQHSVLALSRLSPPLRYEGQAVPAEQVADQLAP